MYSTDYSIDDSIGYSPDERKAIERMYGVIQHEYRTIIFSKTPRRIARDVYAAERSLMKSHGVAEELLNYNEQHFFRELLEIIDHYIRKVYDLYINNYLTDKGINSETEHIYDVVSFLFRKNSKTTRDDEFLKCVKDAIKDFEDEERKEKFIILCREAMC